MRKSFILLLAFLCAGNLSPMTEDIASSSTEIERPAEQEFIIDGLAGPVGTLSFPVGCEVTPCDLLHKLGCKGFILRGTEKMHPLTPITPGPCTLVKEPPVTTEEFLKKIGFEFKPAPIGNRQFLTYRGKIISFMTEDQENGRQIVNKFGSQAWSGLFKNPITIEEFCLVCVYYIDNLNKNTEIVENIVRRLSSQQFVSDLLNIITRLHTFLCIFRNDDFECEDSPFVLSRDNGFKSPHLPFQMLHDRKEFLRYAYMHGMVTPEQYDDSLTYLRVMQKITNIFSSLASEDKKDAWFIKYRPYSFLQQHQLEELGILLEMRGPITLSSEQVRQCIALHIELIMNYDRKIPDPIIESDRPYVERFFNLLALVPVSIYS